MDSAIVQAILYDRNIAYVVTDHDLRVVEVSGAVAILRGENGSALGRKLTDLMPELIGSEEALNEILLGKLPRLELPLVNRDGPSGQVIYLTMVTLPHRDRTGYVVGLIHLVEEVTVMGELEQRLTQQRNDLRSLRDTLQWQNLALEAANVELRRLDEMKSIFVSVAAHELRSPLTSVTGYVEMLLDGDFGQLGDEQRTPLETVRGSTQRLLTVINNLLDVTRIETGRIELVLQPADLPGIAEGIAAEFTPLLAEKSQRLTLRAAADQPRILCDPARTAQIVGNLLGNAIKYTGHGGLITINVGPTTKTGHLQMAVADNGVGISSEDQAKLFSRFFRASTAHLTGAGGAGLGLYITRALVELHGGRIWLESQPDQGSTFYVTFPLADQP